MCLKNMKKYEYERKYQKSKDLISLSKILVYLYHVIILYKV